MWDQSTLWFTPKSDQFQISPVASPEILQHIMKNMAFHSLLRWKMIIQSTLSYGNWKKCPLVEVSAYENYSHKWTPENNRVDGRLQGS